MTENQDVLKERLQQLLAQKKSRKYYAHKLGVSEESVRELMNDIRTGKNAIDEVASLSDYVAALEDQVVKLSEDLKAGTGELTADFKQEVKTLEELIEKCKIDTKKWNIDRYVQNFWGSTTDPHWQVKAFLSVKTPTDNFQKEFKEFLKTYSPSKIAGFTKVTPPLIPYDRACLIINKQDEHLNKYDIHGKNNIQDRFDTTVSKVTSILIQSSLHANVSKIVYILGSDQFNSEWTGCTTRGTPQQNLTSYQDGFTKVCNYEIRMLELLQNFADEVEVMYVPGNHDEYVGWHLIQWLDAFYNHNTRVNFDLSYRYTKCIRYGKSAIMFNHGDAIKPAKLSNMFPIQFKDEWSKAENYYIFTGDKHHEVSLDFTGIKFYQLPALSGSKSSWDDKMGHTCSKAELTAFLIDEEKGMTNIYKQPL